MSRSKNRTRRNRINSKKRLRGGYGNKVLLDTLCNQSNEETLNKVPELKGIVNGLCDNSTENNNNSNSTADNSILNTAGGFLNATGATNVATKALKGFGSIATLPMKIAFGALGKITGFNALDSVASNNNNNNSNNNNSENSNLQGGNKDVSKLIEKLNTIDKKYLGPQIVEELKNFSQSGGSRKRSKRSRKSRKSKRSRNNKKTKKKYL